MNGSIGAILDAYPSWCRPLREPMALGSAGGLSGSAFWRFESSQGLLVLKRWPAGEPPPERLFQIHAWLHQAAHLPYVCQPIADRSGQTFQIREGRLWELEPWMPGTAQDASAASLSTALRGMAALHQALAGQTGRAPSQDLTRRLAWLGSLCQGGYQRLREAVMAPAPARQARDDPTLRSLALAWLQQASLHGPAVREWAQPSAGVEMPIQPCLRDPRPEHFLFQGRELTGLVDFGAMDRDCVALDLSRLLTEWLGADRNRRAQAIEAYTAIRALDLAELRAIELFDRTAAVLGGARWITWHWIDQRRFEAPDAVAAGLRRALERLRLLEQD